MSVDSTERRVLEAVLQLDLEGDAATPEAVALRVGAHPVVVAEWLARLRQDGYLREIQTHVAGNDPGRRAYHISNVGEAALHEPTR
ncbi:MAG: hypothetical protein M3O70_19780 [Actinomycetota bacterium]|nr:hypothetical protein [Actinomycetota bacterium]